MNVIPVIPFFLVANMFVDVSVWPFGPQYSYNLTITYETKRNATGDTIRAKLNTTVQCRLDITSLDLLLCRFNKLSIDNKKLYDDDKTMRQNLRNYVVDMQNFGIKFNKHGSVKTVLLDSLKKDKMIMYIIKKIANQFNSYDAADKDDVEPMSQFIERVHKENGCLISGWISERREQSNAIEERGANFQPVLLSSQTRENDFPVSYTYKKRCPHESENFNPFAGIVKMETFDTQIQINDMYKTFTEIKGYVKSPNNLVDRLDTFKETIELNLETINPMQEDFYITKIPSFPQ